MDRAANSGSRLSPPIMGLGSTSQAWGPGIKRGLFISHGTQEGYYNELLLQAILVKFPEPH